MQHERYEAKKEFQNTSAMQAVVTETEIRKKQKTA